MNKSNSNNSITEQMVIGVTMGDAAGIGPEVVVKALADPHIRRAAKFIVFTMSILFRRGLEAPARLPARRP